jgi:hypothetical protein
VSPDTSANPGPGWKAIDTESVNDSGLTILWQSADGQASIVQMSLTDVVSGGPVSPNPGPSWKAIGMGDFNPGPDFFDSGDGQPDILWQERERPGLDRGDEREPGDWRRAGEPQSWACLEGHRNGRFYRRW